MHVCGSGRGRIGSVASAGCHFWRAAPTSSSPWSRAFLSHISATPHTTSKFSCRTILGQTSARTYATYPPTAQKRPLPQALRTVTAHRMASSASSEAPEWTAQKVRDTFLKYFEDRGHTFGKSRAERPLTAYQQPDTKCSDTSEQSNPHLWFLSPTPPSSSLMLV
jgi:hypothetical protein